jgi:hypothetical protein
MDPRTAAMPLEAAADGDQPAALPERRKHLDAGLEERMDAPGSELCGSPERTPDSVKEALELVDARPAQEADEGVESAALAFLALRVR